MKRTEPPSTKPQTPPVERRNPLPEWNGSSQSATYNPRQKRLEPAIPHRTDGAENRPSKLQMNGPVFENSSLVSIPSSSVIEGDNESQLHSPPGYIDLVVTLRREETGFGFRIIGGTEEGSQVLMCIVC